jgi:uncharacterized protein (TIGR03437 family)
VFAPNRYAVFLTEPSVGARYTTPESLQTAEARGYRQEVERAQAGVMRELASRNVRVVGSVATLLNAIFVVAPPESLAGLKAIPGVAGVVPMRTGHRNLNVATQLMNGAPGATTSAYPPAWSVAPGGSANAGAGIKIGILDTGIDQTHPAFQDSSLAMPAGFPICNTDSSWSCSAFTNNKVIVARSYVRQIAAYSGAANPPSNPLPGATTPTPATSQPDDYSPRDRDGHGTAVASTAAAVYPTAGLTVPINGMAPKAYLGNYKIYGSPGVNDYPPEDVWIQAIDDALNDGMNIVNFSSGFPATTGALDTGAACGNAAGVPCDPVATAFESAVQHGLTIAVSAGNSGVNFSSMISVYPIYASVASPGIAPSVITVGATLNGHAFGPSVSVPGAGAPAGLQNIASVPSDSYAVNLGGMAAPLVDVSFVGDGYACSALPANSLVNSFALVQRGPTASPCAFSTKAANVENAGAIGLILYQAPDSPASWNTLDTTGAYNFIETVDQFYGPLVGISNPTGVQLKNYIDATAIVSYMSNGSVDPWPLVTIDLSGAVRPPDAPANLWATYSSIGPSPAYFGTCGGTCTPSLLKPEMVATGGGDYNLFPDPNDSYMYGFAGLYVAAENFDPNGEVYSSTRYAAANGTSFSSPLTAGAAALVKQAHPSYTPAQIKSALVNWSNASAVPTDDFGDTVDVRETGAGLLDAGAAAQATIAATPSTISFGAVKTGGALPAAQQITIANLGSSAVTLTVAVVQQASAVGAPVTVSPSSLSLGASGSSTASATITVSVTGATPAVGAYYGSVNLTGSGVSMHIPYLFQVGNNLLGSGSTITGNVLPIFGTSFEGIAGTDMGPIALQLQDAGGLPVVGAAVLFAANGGLTMRSESGEPACTGSALAVVCNTDNYGIAYTDVLLGATPAQYTIEAGASGLSATDIPMTVTIDQQPTIAATGVRDAAQAKTTIAPGSYVSIYGAALSAYSGAETTPALPFSLNGVTVSFDAPSANISVPGDLLYTSPTQVNVQVPWELQGLNSSVQMKVTLNEYEYGNVVTVPVADTAPSFFETTPGNVAALIAGTYTYVTPSSPVARGTKVMLYANGLGPVNNQPASGSPAPSTKTANTKNAATMTIGGQSAPITYCGLVPGYPGLYEVDATVPAAISTTGAEAVSLTIGGQTATSSITVK